jgi:hypothetical protein
MLLLFYVITLFRPFTRYSTEMFLSNSKSMHQELSVIRDVNNTLGSQSNKEKGLDERFSETSNETSIEEISLNIHKLHLLNYLISNRYCPLLRKRIMDRQNCPRAGNISAGLMCDDFNREPSEKVHNMLLFLDW